MAASSVVLAGREGVVEVEEVADYWRLALRDSPHSSARFSGAGFGLRRRLARCLGSGRLREVVAASDALRPRAIRRRAGTSARTGLPPWRPWPSRPPPQRHTATRPATPSRDARRQNQTNPTLALARRGRSGCSRQGCPPRAHTGTWVGARIRRLLAAPRLRPAPPAPSPSRCGWARRLLRYGGAALTRTTWPGSDAGCLAPVGAAGRRDALNTEASPPNHLYL